MFNAIGIKNWIELYKVRSLYARKDYMEAYSEHTDRRVLQDPRDAVGGKWDALGKLQFDFLTEEGLKPHHTFLDLGCGTLRGGRHFIRYLEPGRYTGIDISAKAIEYGRSLVEEEGLADKEPRLVVNVDRKLKFQEFRDDRFDFLLAQSVFTHLDQSHIGECFEHIGQIMQGSSIFLFTFYESEFAARTRTKRFEHPASFFEKLAKLYDFKLERAPEYRHPSGQQMLRLTKH
jgi:SAM-dependent methyltransferase